VSLLRAPAVASSGIRRINAGGRSDKEIDRRRRADRRDAPPPPGSEQCRALMVLGREAHSAGHARVALARPRRPNGRAGRRRPSARGENPVATVALFIRPRNCSAAALECHPQNAAGEIRAGVVELSRGRAEVGRRAPRMPAAYPAGRGGGTSTISTASSLRAGLGQSLWRRPISWPHAESARGDVAWERIALHSRAVSDLPRAFPPRALH